VLVIYSYVIYWYFGESKVGFVLMITILITDFFIYLFYNSRIVQTSTPLALLLFFNRLFLFIFGGEQWIYGALILYIIYSTVLAIVIA
jgi:hypothetical protein